MTTIAEGKEAVLAYLEQEARNIAGQPGVYRLVKDDSGNLVAFIAGRSFVGTGSYSMSGNRMVVIDGLVVDVRQNQA
jgi:predicted RNA-binding protein